MLGRIGTWGNAPAARPQGQPRSAALPDQAACLAAIVEAERKSDAKDHILLALGFTEAGRAMPDGLFTVWPWTVNVEGEGRYFGSKAAAVEHVRAALARGARSIDVGCLQVNLRWHPKAFEDLETAFEPAANVAYAARHLAALRRTESDPVRAIGRYHSSIREAQEAYLSRVEGNLRWVAHATDYVGTVTRLAAVRAPVWGRAERDQLAFLSSLFADGAPRPLLPPNITDPARLNPGFTPRP
jgi:hypothetical protein